MLWAALAPSAAWKWTCPRVRHRWARLMTLLHDRRQRQRGLSSELMRPGRDRATASSGCLLANEELLRGRSRRGIRRLRGARSSVRHSGGCGIRQARERPRPCGPPDRWFDARISFACRAHQIALATRTTLGLLGHRVAINDTWQPHPSIAATRCHCRPKLVRPHRANIDPCISPDIKGAFVLQRLQVREQTIEPTLIGMAIADED